MQGSTFALAGCGSGLGSVASNPRSNIALATTRCAENALEIGSSAGSSSPVSSMTKPNGGDFAQISRSFQVVRGERLSSVARDTPLFAERKRESCGG